MTLDQVHQELTQLGVSPEVHALVDDLELYPRVPPLAFDLFRKVRKKIDIPKNVYRPKTSLSETQGRLDEDYNRPLWQVRGMPRKKAECVRRRLCFRGSKRR